MRTRYLIAFICLLALAPLTLHAEEYTLADLWQSALEKSETIKIAEEDLYISRVGRQKAVATLLPTLSAFGEHTRYTEEKSLAGTILQPEYTNQWGLRLDQSFSLSGRELTGYRISRDRIIKNSFDLNAVKGDYLLSIASAFYEVLKSKKALEIADANVKRLSKHRDAAAIKLKVGEATKTDLLRAEAELAGAQSELIRAENILRIAKAVLARTAGITGDYDLRENSRPVDLDSLSAGCDLPVVECLKQRTLEDRAEIRALTMQKNIAEDRVRYARGLYWPSLSVEGVYMREENEPSTAFSVDERIYGVLKVDFPFFEGGLRRAEVREAKAELRQAQFSLQDLKETIAVEVENSYLDLLTRAGIIDSLKAEAEYSMENYNAVSEQFRHGLADSIDVMDANTVLVTAERELANEEYSFHLAFLKLKRATGTLLKKVISSR